MAQIAMARRHYNRRGVGKLGEDITGGDLSMLPPAAGIDPVSDPALWDDYNALVASGAAGGSDFDPSLQGEVTTGMPAAGPLPELTPEELAAQQKVAAGELSNLDAPLKFAQIAATAAAGIIRAAATPAEKAACPSGYLYKNGDCVIVAGATPKPAGQWFAGVSNQTVIMAGGGVLALAIVLPALAGGGGGRRR